MAGLAPMLGFLADRLGVGLAVLVVVCIAAAPFPLLVVRLSSTAQTWLRSSPLDWAVVRSPSRSVVGSSHHREMDGLGE